MAHPMSNNDPQVIVTKNSIGRLRRGLAKVFNKDLDASAKSRPRISSPRNPVRGVPMPSPTFPAEETMYNICPDHDPAHRPVLRVMNSTSIAPSSNPALDQGSYAHSQEEFSRGRNESRVPRQPRFDQAAPLSSHPTPHSSPERSQRGQAPLFRKKSTRQRAPTFESHVANAGAPRTARATHTHVRRPSTGYRSDGRSTVESYRTVNSKRRSSHQRLSRQFVAASPGKISVATPTRARRLHAAQSRARYSIRSRDSLYSRQASNVSFAELGYTSTNEADLESIAETSVQATSVCSSYLPSNGRTGSDRRAPAENAVSTGEFALALPDISQTPFSFSEKDVDNVRLAREAEKEAQARRVAATETEQSRMQKAKIQQEAEERMMSLMRDLFEKQNGQLDKRLQEVADAYYLARPWSPEDVAVRLEQRFTEDQRQKEAMRRHESRRQRAKQNETLRAQRAGELAEINQGMQHDYEHRRRAPTARSGTQSSLDSHSTQSSEELKTPPRFSALRPRVDLALKPAPLRLHKDPTPPTLSKERTTRRVGADPGPNPSYSPPVLDGLLAARYAQTCMPSQGSLNAPLSAPPTRSKFPQNSHTSQKAPLSAPPTRSNFPQNVHSAVEAPLSAPPTQTRFHILPPTMPQRSMTTTTRPATREAVRQTAQTAVAVNGGAIKLKPTEVDIKPKKSKSKQAKKATKLRPFPLVATRDSYVAMKMQRLSVDNASDSGDGEWETLDVNDPDASPDRKMSWQHLHGHVPSFGNVGLAR